MLPVVSAAVLALLVAILLKIVLTAPLRSGSALRVVAKEIRRDRFDWNARPHRWWKFWRRRGRNAYRKI